MSNIITQFMVDNVVHDIGADAKNVAYNEYISVKTQLENHNAQIVNMANDKANTKDVYNKNEAYNKEEIDNMIGNGTIIINQGGKQKGIFTTNQNKSVTINLDAGSGVSDADAVIENSLTVNGKLVLNDYKPSNIFSITQVLDFKEQVSDFNLQLNEDEWGGLLPENFIYTNFNGTTTQYSYYIDYSFNDESITNTIFERLKINHYYLLTEDIGRSVNFIATPIKNSGFSGLRIFTSQKITYQATFDVQYEILMTPTQKGTLIQGQYANEENIGNYAHVVGNGTSDFDRKNIYTLDWDGNAAFAGDIKLKTIEEKHTWINESTQYNFKPYFNYMTFNDTSSSLNLNNLNAKNPSSNNVYYHKIFFTLSSSTIGAIGGSKIENYYYFGNLVCTYIPTGASGGAGGWTESDVLALYNQNTNTVEVWTSQRLDIDIENISTLYFNVSKIASNAELETNISLKQTIQDLQSRIAALEAKINS